MGQRMTYFEWVEATGNSHEFTNRNDYTDQDMIWECPYMHAEVKVVHLWFPPDVGGWVLVRLALNGTAIAPSLEGGWQTRGFTSDDDHLPIFLNMPLQKTDKISIEYINLHANNLNFSVKMEVEQQDEKTVGVMKKRNLPDVPGMKKDKKKQPKGEPKDFSGGF